MEVKKKNPGARGVERKQTGLMDLGRAPGHAIRLHRTASAVNWLPSDSVELFEAGSLEKKTMAEPIVLTGRSERDDQLKMFGKYTDNLDHGEEGGLTRTKCYKRRSSRQMMNTDKKFDNANGHVLSQKPADFQSCMDPFAFRMTKRKCGHLSPSHAKGLPGADRRVKETDIVVGSKELVWRQFSESLKKVDAVASPRTMMGEKYMHSSFRDKTAGNFEMNAEHQKPIVDTRCLSSRSIDCNEAESSGCSVASCSSSSKPWHKLPHEYKRYPSKDMDSCFDDAESSCALRYGKECPYTTKEELAAEIHKLELHAYRCTMEALYASGPLSWEQEALMTNLRLNLHISNDEHLLELRQLASSQNF